MHAKRYRNNIHFLQSAAKIEQMPADEGSEVAFIGASNVGKSSAINTITGIKGLARVGKTPGVTQLINTFVVDSSSRLIDLPGYGYAKVPIKIRNNWHELVNDYFVQRRSLRGIFLLSDIRHPLKDNDLDLLEWAKSANLAVCLLLTKADKLKRDAINIAVRATKTKLVAINCNDVEVIVFSAHSSLGLTHVYAMLDLWLQKVSNTAIHSEQLDNILSSE